MWIITILLFTLIVAAFAVLSNMYSNTNYEFPALPACFLFGLLVTIYSGCLLHIGVKQGQIQVLSGSNIKYELKENSDKTKEWVEIESKDK